jgi:hypothetical protein
MNNPAVEAIKFALITDCPMDFLRLWMYGDFNEIRAEWPECPAEVFIGADSSLDEVSQ